MVAVALLGGALSVVRRTASGTFVLVRGAYAMRGAARVGNEVKVARAADTRIGAMCGARSAARGDAVGAVALFCSALSVQQRRAGTALVVRIRAFGVRLAHAVGGFGGRRRLVLGGRGALRDGLA
jgi:hypothetical protein